MESFRVNIAKEYRGIFNFIAPLFAVGVIYYFSLNFEPTYYKLAFLGLFLFAISLAFLKGKASGLIFLVILPLLGFAYSSFYSQNIYEYKDINEDQVYWVRADLTKAEKKEFGHRIWIKNVDLWTPETKNLPLNKVPEIARLNVRTKFNDNVRVGDRVAFKAKFSKPPQYPPYPDGYDFNRYAYYDRIDAVGFSLSEIKVFKANESSLAYLNQSLREATSKKIDNSSHELEVRSIAKALTIANKSEIPESLLEAYRNSGMGHILAISGLHMAIIIVIFFSYLRIVINLIPKVNIYYNVKKISAVIALIIGLGYLSLTDFPTSATRAYIMAGIYLFGILIDKDSDSKRALSAAAIIIILLNPHSILTPSFQMSFAATLVLITFYEFIDRRFEKFGFKTLLFTMLSSAVAILATAPFALFHFGNVAPSGVIANLLAIPFLTIVIMPLMIIQLMLMPLMGVVDIFLYPIKFMNEWAYFISSFDISSYRMPKINGIALACFSAGIVIFCFFKTKLRYTAALPALIGVIIYINQKLPDALILPQKGVIAVNTPRELLVNKKRKASYVVSMWSEWLGKDISHQKDISIYTEYEQFLDKKYYNQGTLLIYLDDKITHDNVGNIVGNRLWHID